MIGFDEKMESLTHSSHRRLNLLTGEWVLVSPQRSKRPWQGQREDLSRPSGLAYDPTCYLCPGNQRANGETNPAYTSTFVFDNDFAALEENIHPSTSDDPLLVAETETGICRVVCFSPRHDLTLADMSVAEIAQVVSCWVEQTRDLSSQPDILAIQIFENRGEMMGCSNPHPHGQIWATQNLSNEMIKETLMQKNYYAAHERRLLRDYLDRELQAGDRIIYSNNEFVTLVPFWAVWPFETMILPRHKLAAMTELSKAQVSGLADVLSDITQRYNKLFNMSFPYSMGIHQRPFDQQPHPEWLLHVHFYPPLLRSATIKKFMVGFELLATPQRDITPEQAATKLREVRSP